jgi:hypothetical protein
MIISSITDVALLVNEEQPIAAQSLCNIPDKTSFPPKTWLIDIIENIPNLTKYLYKDKQYNTSIYKYSRTPLPRTRKGQSLNNRLYY